MMILNYESNLIQVKSKKAYRQQPPIGMGLLVNRARIPEKLDILKLELSW